MLKKEICSAHRILLSIFACSLILSLGSLSLYLFHSLGPVRFPQPPVYFPPILWECTGMRLHLMGFESHLVSFLRPMLYMPLEHSVLLILLCVFPALEKGGGVVWSPNSERLSLYMPDAQNFHSAVCEDYSCWVVRSAGAVILSCLRAASFTLDKLDSLSSLF